MMQHNVMYPEQPVLNELEDHGMAPSRQAFGKEARVLRTNKDLPTLATEIPRSRVVQLAKTAQSGDGVSEAPVLDGDPHTRQEAQETQTDPNTQNKHKNRSEVLLTVIRQPLGIKCKMSGITQAKNQSVGKRLALRIAKGQATVMRVGVSINL